MKWINYGRQYIDEEDVQAVAQVLRSDFLTKGPKIPEFEEAFAQYTGARYAVAIANGTAALHAACYAAGITKGDEVLVPAITFAASANAVLYMGGTPVFCDIDPISYTISIPDIKNKITKRTKAIIAVHYAGSPCDMNAIQAIAKEHKLLVIEDAAHAVGAVYGGKKIGSIGDMTTFSFHPVKQMTCGEGGMITTNRKELYEQLALFREHGITRERSQMEQDEGAWYYEQLLLGYNYRMTDIQAALGITQLKKVDTFIQRRKQLVQLYNEAFQNEQELQLPQMDAQSSWHLYVLQLKTKNRREVFDKLRDRGIGVNVHYIPVYRLPYYQHNGFAGVYLENSESFYARALSIPLFYGLTDVEVDYVISQIKEVLKNM